MTRPAAAQPRADTDAAPDPSRLELVEAAVLAAPMVLSGPLDRGDAELRARVHECIRSLPAAAYSLPEHQQIAHAMQEMLEEGREIDLLSLYSHLRASGHLEEAGGDVYLADLQDAVPTAAHIEQHAEIVRNEWTRRELVQQTRKIADRALIRRNGDVHQDVEEVLREMQELPARLPGASARPLFQADEVKFGRFLDSEPPPMRWLLRSEEGGLLPLGVTGAIGGMGGIGKSSLIYGMAFSIATGTPFLGFAVEEPGGVLYISAEDDEGELHRRAWSLLSHYRRMAHQAGETIAEELLAENLHVVPRVGEDNLLTATGADGEVRITPLVGRTIAAAQPIQKLRLIICDPLSRFAGGKENAPEDRTRFVEALETIRKETGATVLSVSHVSQQSIREGGGQESLRGTTSLVDGLRWVATLRPMGEDQAPDYALATGDAGRYLRLRIPKNNYAPPFPGLWLKRHAGGVLERVDLEDRSEVRDRQMRERDYLEVVEAVQAILRQHGPMSRTQMEEGFAGPDGPVGVGQRSLRQHVRTALQRGDLGQTPNAGRGGGYHLDLPGAGQ